MADLRVRDIRLDPMGNLSIVGVASGQLLTPEQCEELLSHVDPDRWEGPVEAVAPPSATPATPPGSAPSDEPVLHQVRHQLVPDAAAQLVLPIVANAVTVANDGHYRFNLTGLIDRDPALFLRLDAGDPDQIIVDLRPPRSTRKLVAVIPLSGSEADGGVQQFPTSGTVGATENGSVTMFPSYLPYRFTPITGNPRVFLTAWVHGPHFR